MNTNQATKPTVLMPVTNIPFPNVLQNSSTRVTRIRRHMKTHGYIHDPQNPITILTRTNREPILIDGNHRTEAMKRGGIPLNTEVPVHITTITPDWLPHYL